MGAQGPEPVWGPEAGLYREARAIWDAATRADGEGSVRAQAMRVLLPTVLPLHRRIAGGGTQANATAPCLQSKRSVSQSLGALFPWVNTMHLSCRIQQNCAL